MDRKVILITGGAGFIGRALIAQCLEHGNAITVVDNLSVGRIDNLRPYMDRIEFCQADILNESALEDVFAKHQPNIVFHLAAHHFIPFCEAHPGETLRVNVEGTYSVLREAARHGAEVAVVASSGSIYPNCNDLLDEDLGAAPVDVYGLSKHLTEVATEFVAGTTSLRCVAARLFNTYGPHESNPHLIPHIIESLRHSSEVQLGNVHTKRDYIYVDDVARILYGCAQNACERYSVVNVGTGTEYSAEEIVGTLSQLLGREITIKVDASRLRAVDKLHQRADTRKLESLIGRQPLHSLSAGLRKLLTHERLQSHQFV
jgi:UDP-glucose 4-epimerase